jgi:hypothetical protein
MRSLHFDFQFGHVNLVNQEPEIWSLDLLLVHVQEPCFVQKVALSSTAVINFMIVIELFGCNDFILKLANLGFYQICSNDLIHF